MSSSVHQLVEMGFDRGKVRRALIRANNDIQQAMNFLVEPEISELSVPTAEQVSNSRAGLSAAFRVQTVLFDHASVEAVTRNSDAQKHVGVRKAHQPAPHVWGAERGAGAAVPFNEIEKICAPRRDGDWYCPACYALVFASKKECFKCHTPKPGARGGRVGGVSGAADGPTKDELAKLARLKQVMHGVPSRSAVTYLSKVTHVNLVQGRAGEHSLVYRLVTTASLGAIYVHVYAGRPTKCLVMEKCEHAHATGY